MRRRWLVGLLLVPLADMLGLFWVAGYIGTVETVALVVLTALVGLLLVRAEGRHTLRRLQRRAAAGELPSDELLDAGLLVAAAAFLLTPGLVTDVVGLLLVVPVTRAPVRAAVRRWLVPMLEARTGGFVSGDVYTGGYPFGPGSSGSSEETVDLGPDAYRIDVEGDDEE